MKKLMIGMLVLTGISASLWAQGGAVEVKGFYFFPAEQIFQDVYGRGVYVGAEGFVGLSQRLDLWVSGDYFRRKGELTFSKQETFIRIIPLSAGLRWRIPAGRFHFFVSGGAGYFLFKEENLIGTAKASKIGYLGKAGFFVNITKGFYVNTHLQYSYCSIQPERVRTQIGGLRIGVGMGYDFGLGEKEEKWVWKEVK